MGRELTRWVSAFSSRLWAGMIMAFLLGQVLGMNEMGYASISIFIQSMLFVLLAASSFILLNHYADQRADRMKCELNENSTRFQNFPTANRMLFMGLSLMLTSFASLFFLAQSLPLMKIIPLGILGFLIFGMYSFRPVRMNYRGGGEILEILGVAVLLPLFSSFLYTNSFEFNYILSLVLPFALLVLGNSVAHSLVNEKSDKYAGKRTLVTVLGFKSSRLFIEYSLLAFLLSLIILKYFIGHPVPWIFMAVASVVIFYFYSKIKNIPPKIQLTKKDSINAFEFYMNSATIFAMGIVNFGILYDYLVRP